MKKIGLTVLVLLSFISCTEETIEITGTATFPEETVEIFYVDAPTGLNMRSAPNGEVLTLLNHGEEVELISGHTEENKEEIGGNTGYWVEVKRKDQKGWVFDYYLSTEQTQTADQNLEEEESSQEKESDQGSNNYSDATVSENRLFLRPVEFKIGEKYMLVKEGRRFLLSPDVYEDIVDPYKAESTAYYLYNDFHTEDMILDYYPEHIYETDLIGVKKEGQYGFIDVKNKFLWAVEPQFDEVHSFKEGLAAVKKNGKWGYIDYSGTMVIPPEYDFVFDFYNGLSTVVQGEKVYEGNWGLIDTKGNRIIDPEKPNPFSYIHPFYDRVISKTYLESEAYVGLNRKGEIITDRIYEMIGKGGPVDPLFLFDKTGHAKIYAENREDSRFTTFYGVLNKEGQWAVELVADKQHVDDFLESEWEASGLDILTPSRDSESRKYGYKGSDGEWIIDPVYSYAGRFQDGMAEVQQDGKTGLIDDAGNWLLKPEYKNISPYSQKGGPYMVTTQLSTKYVLPSGETIFILSQSQEGTDFKNGIAFIYEPVGELDYDTSLQLHRVIAIDETGTQILPEFYENVYILMV